MLTLNVYVTCLVALMLLVPDLPPAQSHARDPACDKDGGLLPVGLRIPPDVGIALLNRVCGPGCLRMMERLLRVPARAALAWMLDRLAVYEAAWAWNRSPNGRKGRKS